MKLERRKVVTLKRVGLVLLLSSFVLLLLPNGDLCFETMNGSENIHNSSYIQPGNKESKPFQKNSTSNSSKQTMKKIAKTIIKKDNVINLHRTMVPYDRMSIKIFSYAILKRFKQRYRITKPFAIRPRTKAPLKHFICLNLMGRLGNLMFQYAAAYGIARSKGMDVVIASNENLTNIFHLEYGARIVNDISICDEVRTIQEIRSCAYDRGMTNFRSDRNIALFGYLQSFKYFEKVSKEIRRQFTFRDEIKNQAKKVIRDIFKEHFARHGNGSGSSRRWVFIAIHVRRGDMVDNPFGYTVATRDYFERAQKMFLNLYKDAIFVVCSDEIEWCQRNLKLENTYFVTGNSPEVDMAVISLCNHTISSVGSFSWWSGWLSNGKITYYYPPAKPGSQLRREYSRNYKDFFPSNWIRIH